MNGFFPTPAGTVDDMVARLFRERDPVPQSVVLDPGCGDGALIAGIVRWCGRRNLPLPRIVGIECAAGLAQAARRLFASHPTIQIENGDFLEASERPTYDFIICNPPYIPITAMSESEKSRYRARYRTASGRFDLYLLFFEQALMRLRAGGRLVFITPEKFLYVESACPLRTLLAERRVEEIHLVDERTFGDLVTYPTITTVVNHRARNHKTRFTARDGRTSTITLTEDGSSWLPIANGNSPSSRDTTLEDISLRVSCGVATGADSVFVRRTAELRPELRRFAYPTIAGRELRPGAASFDPRSSMLVPYSGRGQLLDESQLGALKAYLEQPEHRSRLMKRTCVRRKPWYAFHETPPLPLILRPKIICKDIAAQPQFWINHGGDLLPRHSVYYIIPRTPEGIDALCEYLNSPVAQKWLAAHCQRAANDFLRLQSHVLKRLPIPADLAAVLRPNQSGARATTTTRLLHQCTLPLSTSEAV